MKIPPKYSITPAILELIAKIDANRYYFSSGLISIPLKDKIQHLSLLKSSLFSARIEGNPLTIKELENTSDRQRKNEIFNILKAIRQIERAIQPNKRITKRFILEIHKIVMGEIGGGVFRKEPGAIFNQEGFAVYISPPPKKIFELIDKLLLFANSNKEKFPLISAFISHLIFEKIHPFIDGNGRVGRLLSFAILKAKGYDFGFHIPFEEYLDEHKDDYYYHMDTGLTKTNDYLKFMLKAFLEETERIKDDVLRGQDDGNRLLLPPRQEEIYQLIKDHEILSLDSIKRRFLKIPSRTLRYDIKKLLDKELIIKIGITKGSFYRIKP